MAGVGGKGSKKLEWEKKKEKRRNVRDNGPQKKTKKLDK